MPEQNTEVRLLLVRPVAGTKHPNGEAGSRDEPARKGHAARRGRPVLAALLDEPTGEGAVGRAFARAIARSARPPDYPGAA